MGSNAVGLNELLECNEAVTSVEKPNQNIVMAAMAASLNHVCALKH